IVACKHADEHAVSDDWSTVAILSHQSPESGRSLKIGVQNGVGRRIGKIASDFGGRPFLSRNAPDRTNIDHSYKTAVFQDREHPLVVMENVVINKLGDC